MRVPYKIPDTHLCYRLSLVSQFHRPSTNFIFLENYPLPVPQFDLVQSGNPSFIGGGLVGKVCLVLG